jgi:hypothetical protein
MASYWLRHTHVKTYLLGKINLKIIGEEKERNGGAGILHAELQSDSDTCYRDYRKRRVHHNPVAAVDQPHALHANRVGALL